jgi:hypothetical protein
MRVVVLWTVALLLAAVLCSLLANANGTKNDGTCGAAEVVPGAAEYNKLTCIGIDLMGENAYGEAVRHFERALQIPLLEQPNFKLLPRLALSYFRAGNLEKARTTLGAAELALSVFAGVIQCVEGESGFSLVYSSGAPVTALQKDKIGRRMCGAAYDGYYVRPSLESFVSDSEMIRYFFQVREEIDRGTQ